MKLKYYIYTLIASATIIFSACSPDEYSLGKQTYTSDDLVQGIAFTVTPDAQDPNTIHLQSLLKGVISLWETPQGRSESDTMSIQLPFAGDYEITFGVITPAGPVYGPPYKFTVTENNFNMLSDPIWTNLAGGVGKTRKWVPIDRNYGIGRCTTPMVYVDPTNVMNDGSGASDLIFGSANWKPNYEATNLFPAGDPYFNSYMTFGLDAANGSTVEVFRNDANGGTLMNGKFSLNLSDPKRPTITFDNCYLLHGANFDNTCNNYTLNLQIIELTPYLLQVATMRTDSEGSWWLVWNFISEEAKEDPSIIPTDDAGLLQTLPVKEPDYSNLSQLLFTIASSNATYIATATTFLLNEDAPYDWMWWNGATGAWESNGFSSAADYTKTWAPAFTGTDDFSMNLSTTGTAGTYSCVLETVDGTVNTTFTIVGNKLVFADEISLLSVSNDYRTIDIRGKEFTVMACSPDDSEVILGIPDGTDEKGVVNRYLCAKLTIKPISSDSGPTVIIVDNSKLNYFIQDSQYFRIQLYNPWAGDIDWPIDISKVKLRKDQTLTIKFTIDGISWDASASPKAVICNNIPGTDSWEPNCFNYDWAVNLNKNGETTVTYTNTTGSTITFDGTSAITICVQLSGFGTAPMVGSDLDTSAVTATITSMTIE